MSTHKVCLIEALLMSTHKVCLHQEVREISVLLDEKRTLSEAYAYLTHCRLNELTHPIYWKILISI